MSLEKSELDFFKKFVDRIMEIQQQLHSFYYSDRPLIDGIMNEIYMARIMMDGIL